MTGSLMRIESPSVAVIIAAYNAAATIERALASALAQPEVYTVIVVDDASTDETVATVKRLQADEPRIQLIQLAHNSGPATARNRALDMCATDWIGVLDADDYFLPGRMAQLLAHADQAELIADDMLRQDTGAASPRPGSLLAGRLPDATFIDLSTFVLSNIPDPKQERMELGFLKPIIRIDFLQQHGLRYRESMRLGEDYELYTRCLGLGGRLRLIPQAGYVSMIRPDSLSSAHGHPDLSALYEADQVLLDKLPLSKPQKQALKRHAVSTLCRLRWLELIDAIKHKRLTQSLRCFIAPWRVQTYLLARLVEQFRLRILRRAPHRQA